MQTLLVILAVAYIVGTLLMIRVASRPPHCPDCGVTAEAAAEEDQDAGPVAVGVITRCTRCGAVIGRRYLMPL
jgi:predicted RNA-binding Zn-ribbon protein involved in translation (DUF1610 family)